MKVLGGGTFKSARNVPSNFDELTRNKSQCKSVFILILILKMSPPFLYDGKITFVRCEFVTLATPDLAERNMALSLPIPWITLFYYYIYN